MGKDHLKDLKVLFFKGFIYFLTIYNFRYEISVQHLNMLIVIMYVFLFIKSAIPNKTKKRDLATYTSSEGSDWILA